MENSKKIIMLLTNEFGPDVRVYKEATYLISKGFDVEILCWQRDENLKLPKEENIDGILVKRFLIPSVAGTGLKQIKSFIKFIKSCKAYLKNHPCDYLHCNDIDGAITGYLSRSTKTPMVFDMHEFYENGNFISKYIWRKLTIFLIKKSVAALRVNDVYLNKNYSSVHDKLYLLKNYPDSSLVQRKEKKPNDTFRIGYHGAVRGQIRDFRALFDAVANDSQIRVDINGGGIDYQELKELEKAYTNVHINGPYNGTKELTKLYENTDVLFCCYNPYTENHKTDVEAVKYFEAIITGTPMIMTSGMYMSKKVIENEYGLCCDTTNLYEIREVVLKFKNDKEFWNKCSKNELKDAYKYDWKNAVKVLDEIYK